MKTLLLTLFAFFLAAGTCLSAMNHDPAQPNLADIKVKVYGAGGVVVVGETQKVCPNKDVAVCADITIPAMVAPGGGSGDLDLEGLEGTLNHRGSLNRIRLMSGTAKPDGTGSELDFSAEGRNFSFIYLN
ncbi:MAG: hypothetical protein HUU34_21555 [Saprospiraceae bacterium]|jgi:hypothetical protein|nr:hypothetical protein [Saprospiraceae bacterium]